MMNGTPDDSGADVKLRGSVLVQQQRRIIQLEEELQRTWSQMEQMRAVIEKAEKARANKESSESRSKDGKKPQSRYWTPAEHQRFLEALEKHGPRDVKAIAKFVRTRTATQVRTHAQKFYLRLEKEKEIKREETKGGKLDGKPRTRQTAMVVPPEVLDDEAKFLKLAKSTDSDQARKKAKLK